MNEGTAGEAGVTGCVTGAREDPVVAAPPLGRGLGEGPPTLAGSIEAVVGGGRSMQMRSDRCAVCGGHEIECDEVLEGGVLRLATCRRCAHRWTERSPRLLLAAGREGADAEVAAAA